MLSYAVRGRAVRGAVVSDGRTTILKIRYYNIQRHHFSWTADHSSDGGASWERDYLRIEATRRVPTAARQ